MARRVEYILRGTDQHPLVAFRRLGQARTLCSGQHVLRVGQRPGSDYGEVPWYGNSVIDGTVFEIEFLPEIGERIPATQIIVDAKPGVPLGDFENFSVFDLGDCRASAPFARNGVMPGDVNLQRMARRRKRFWQAYLHAGIGDMERHGLFDAVYLDRHALNGIAFRAGRVPVGKRHPGAGILAIKVLVEL